MNRNTIQCDLVRQAVTALDHPTADEVYEYISGIYPSMGKCTVYRNLNKLADMGELLHISLSDTPDRFDITVKPHYHIICKSCGRLGDAELFKEPELTKELADTHGFKVTGCEILFSGLCAKCANK